MAELYRAMKEDASGMPQVGQGARLLGVRPGVDVPAVAANDVVTGGQGGPSVSPHDPLNLPYFRRPPAYGGVGKDPVWVIDEVDLGPDLYYRPDPDNPGQHGFLEPVRPMGLTDYELALTRTQDRWRKVLTP